MSQRATSEKTQAADGLLARVMAPEDVDDSTAESILDAALTQFQLVGLRRTTVDDVGRQAGLSRMTIYRRYPNKQALTEVVMLREVRRIIQLVERRVAAANPEDRMVQSFVFGLRLVRTHPLLSRLLVTEPEDVLPFLTVNSRPFISAGIAFIAEQVRQAQRDSEGPQADPDAVAEIFARLVHSLVLAPEGGLALDDDSEAGDFARRYLAPIALGPPQGHRLG